MHKGLRFNTAMDGTEWVAMDRVKQMSFLISVDVTTGITYLLTHILKITPI